MEMELNPYAPPKAQALQANTQAETIRREYINTEASIKSVGLLYYLMMVVLIAAGVFLFTEINAKSVSTALPVGGILLFLGTGVGFVAHGLRRLRSWARMPTIIISSIALIYGLVNLSGGIVIHIYILAKMMSRQAQFVLTPEYQQIIAATPHVKRKTSIVMKVLLILLLILLIGIIAATYLSK